MAVVHSLLADNNGHELGETLGSIPIRGTYARRASTNNSEASAGPEHPGQHAVNATTPVAVPTAPDEDDDTDTKAHRRPTPANTGHEHHPFESFHIRDIVLLEQNRKPKKSQVSIAAPPAHHGVRRFRWRRALLW